MLLCQGSAALVVVSFCCNHQCLSTAALLCCAVQMLCCYVIECCSCCDTFLLGHAVPLCADAVLLCQVTASLLLQPAAVSLFCCIAVLYWYRCYAVLCGCSSTLQLLCCNVNILCCHSAAACWHCGAAVLQWLSTAAATAVILWNCCAVQVLWL